ncbi:hypothetical protein Patl1_04577 [Pistacia atlantica]|uniref:Uncharacterized protein n=1 Tax=Pistacia atlantica TaxID=434234 RepID=A0ACC1BT61_9ROSI|nr:hypothetical protein Patl1_04577 [Pistacia atlantica]
MLNISPNIVYNRLLGCPFCCLSNTVEISKVRRGTVELTIEIGDGSSFSPEAGGEQRKTATIQVVLDGYSASQNWTRLSCIEKAILTDSGLDKNSGDSVPLEIKPSGQFEPLYKTTLSDGELLVLPLSVYGAVAMAHSEVSEEYSAPYQFFFYPYDKRNVSDCSSLLKPSLEPNSFYFILFVGTVE